MSFKYSYIIYVQLNTLEMGQNIKMSDPYKTQIGLTHWKLWETLLQNLPEESSSNDH